MLWRSNKGKDRTDHQTDNRIESNRQETPKVQPESRSKALNEEMQKPASREDLLQHEEAQEMYEKILELRKSLDSLKSPQDTLDENTTKTAPESGGNLQFPSQEEEIHLEESQVIFDAEQAIIDQAKRDAEQRRYQHEQARLKELSEKQEMQKVLEAQKKAELIGQEAIIKRQQAIEAQKRAKEVTRKKALEEMDAAHKRSEMSESGNTVTPEELAAFFGEDARQQEETLQELEAARQTLLSAQEEQGEVLEHISKLSESSTEYLAEKQKVQTEKANDRLAKQKAEIERVNKLEQERIAKQQAEIERANKLERTQKKKDEKLHKAEDKERHRREKKEAAERTRLEKAKKVAERAQLEKTREAAAEMGGGVVNVNGVTINTEIKEVPRFSWKDFFGLISKKEKTAQTKAERRALKKEREKRREEARAMADRLGKETLASFENSRIGRRLHGIKLFCEHHKAGLLFVFAIILTAAVGTAGIFNYCTAYEYSYNGKALGIVKEKDEVLQITDLVQGALTEDKNVSVVIDAKDDITFERVSAMGDVKIDNTEEVLKRLTYMGDLNVKAYGIYVDGNKVGAVESKEIAAEVMQDIKDRYTSNQEGAKVEDAVFIEKVEVKQSNTGLQDISSRKEMVDLLCTSGEKETLHKVVAGETLADIAKLYSMKEEDLLKNNSSVDAKKLVVGSTLVIKQTAPILTVKITELLTYEKTVEFEIENKDSSDIYEGYSETQQKGENGLSEITSRIVTVNGETIKETALVTTVKKEPVTEVVLVGVKERPPTVGSGKYIWPMSGGYTITSKFGTRWGRMHSGIDMGCPVGSDVLAADGGTVTKAGYNGSYGYLLVIDHQNGMETYYAHNSKLLVDVGDKVFQGQHIAESGNTGRSTGPHLHFEVHVSGTAQNPLNYLP